jgi:type II secretory pathway pseudopilin PulG
MLWVWIAVVVVALIIMGSAALSLLGRLSGLQHAAVRLQRRQQEAMKLQEGAAVLEQSVLALHERAEITQGRLATIQAGLGRDDR